MEIQKNILLFFSSHRINILDSLVEFFTMFGEETIIIAIIVFVYWNVNKKKGMSICSSLLIASNIMGIVKAIVRFPRPWVLVPELKSLRVSTATGYSFPSGHVTCASSSYTTAAMSFKKRWISIISATLIVLVAFSRMYLCVHWPLDVAGGLVLGCGVSFTFFNVLNNLYDNKEKGIKYAFIFGAICEIVAFVMSVLLLNQVIDSNAFLDLSKSLAIAGGAFIGYG
ncbi:MAG: phosphatase PAP2 family protein, partial [Sphaerochaetaceae bacterium]|nr:phosphatase PAP2 family protein [Sphaerochaetaceae bacterium]